MEVTTYELLKDFAGPVATILAASTAAFITYRFAKIQAQIAKTQAGIALDKLKHDLFEKRYAIYLSAKRLVEYVIVQHDIDKVDPAMVRALYITLDESRFFFDADVRTFLADLAKTSEALLSAMSERQRMNMDDDEKWKRLTDVLSSSTIALNSMYADLPNKFEAALGFKQMTST